MGLRLGGWHRAGFGLGLGFVRGPSIVGSSGGSGTGEGRDAVAASGYARGRIGAIDGPREGLDVFLAGLVIEIFDSPLYWATVS